MNKFEILTPLGFTVHTSEEYWQKVITKYPDIADLELEGEQALANPDEFRHSSRDRNILFYSVHKSKRWVVAVTKLLNGDEILITAYQTDPIKEGELIWHK
ncbi:hypothetical protein [Synechococcus sp. PCC 7502]|uniref:hypothetical protein n=1 Tax=Synechococcus sp. PCC 7502 TaxID=1173263 RepID=UPI0002F5167A|nr:hypothetical protein [Synechococcus sp. PCC 7502]